MKRYCLALDLKNDEELIREYEYWHRNENTWPEIKKSIIDAGIINMEIFRVQNRLFMIMDTNDTFDFDVKAKMDTGNPKVQAWENMMLKFQQKLPGAKEHEKWMLMTKIFQL